MSLHLSVPPRFGVKSATLRAQKALIGWFVFSMVGIGALCAAEPRPLVVGHRGLMHAAPECTLAGFRACLALRIGFEFDVRRCKDDILVCLHDPTLDRTTDGTGKLAGLAFDQVKRLDAGSRFDLAFRNERIPRIEEILTLIAGEGRGSALFAVDLKDTGGGLEEKVIRLAESRNVLDQLVFIGATIESAEVRLRLKAASDLARTARLAATAADIAEALADENADWVYLRFLPTASDMQQIRAAGKRAFVAGPLVAGNEPANWSTAAQLGFDGILTDYPLDLARQLRMPK
jgi:glycerophosphoryl diester phosphodiesterase